MADAPGKISDDSKHDLVSIDDSTGAAGFPGAGSANGASGQDSLVNAAAMFEQQLEQMSAWKHQLAAQMEVLRRDGIKILERQKQLAIEKRKLAEDREAVTADRAHVQKLHTDLETQRSDLELRAAELAAARTELAALAAEKQSWIDQLALAKRGAEEALARRDAAAAQVAQAEARLQEIAQLESQRDTLVASIAQAQASLAELENQKQQIDAAAHALQLREAEVNSRERGLGEQEAKFLAMEITVREQTEQLEIDRRHLQSAQKEIDEKRAALAQDTADAESKISAAQRLLTLDRAHAEEQLSEALTAQRAHQEAASKLNAREREIDAREQQLADREKQIARQAADCLAQEHAVMTSRNEIAAAQASLAQQQTALTAQEKELAARKSQLDSELAQRTAEVAATQKHLDEERAAVAKTRQEMQRKLEQAEQEHVEQLELLTKQTKRLSERRAELEAATADLQKEIEQRVARATESLKDELGRTQQGYEQKLAALREQLEQQERTGSDWQTRETELRKNLSDAEWQARMAREELGKLHNELEGVTQARTELEKQLSDQLRRFDREAGEWQRKLDLVLADHHTQQDAAAAEALRTAQTEIEHLQKQIAELTAARGDVDRRLAERDAAHAEEITRLRADGEKLLTRERAASEERVAELMIEIGTLRSKSAKAAPAASDEEITALRNKLSAAERELADALAARETQLAQWQQRFNQLSQELAAAKSAAASTPSETDPHALAALQKQLSQMEAQRNELATQLFAVQDALQRQAEEATLTRSSLEGRILDLQEKNETLEAEKSRWSRTSHPSHASGASPADAGKLSRKRERLLRQARNLRAYRKQMRESSGTLESGREDLAQQREQLRVRKENLEQVKRLLEKQEMVMARKLADHNALKTVAAVGIFVIMVLGGAFLGVYKFVAPTFRSEAVVQLAAPAELTGKELAAWQTRQAEFLRNNEVTYAAWKILRGPDERYAMHDVRDEWIASLQKNLTLQPDAQSKTLALRYTGPDSLGVSQVANALATAYANPGLRETTEQTKSFGAGSTILAKATPPMFAVVDNRLTIGLSVVAIVLFASLIVVVIFRHYVARQLREIDQMADDSDLEDIKGELPAEAKPA